MPIRPENVQRYPADWPQIRARALERAGHCCQFCGVRNHVWRNEDGEVTGDALQAGCWQLVDGLRVAYIVLTVAHLDHQPENCADENLRALCQRCHLRHDHVHHQQTAYATRREGRVVAELF